MQLVTILKISAEYVEQLHSSVCVLNVVTKQFFEWVICYAKNDKWELEKVQTNTSISKTTDVSSVVGI